MNQLVAGKIIEQVVDLHARELDKALFPCPLSVEKLMVSESSRVFSEIGHQACFYMHEPSIGLKDLDYPFIKHLTFLGDETSALHDKVIESFMRIGRRLMVIVESYNTAAQIFVQNLKVEETHYWHYKFLCRSEGIAFSKEGALGDFSVRNYLGSQDDIKYVELNNKVLGFLGTPVNNDFMQFVAKRPSFDPEGYFFAENSYGEIIGFLSIEKEPWGDIGSGFGYIYQIGVVEEWRGKGVADTLLSKAKEYALSHGIDRIGVGVRRSNKPAAKFFIKHGFKIAYESGGYLLEIA